MNKEIFCDTPEKILTILRKLYPHHVERSTADTVVLTPAERKKGIEYSIVRQENSPYHHSCGSTDIHGIVVLFKSMTVEKYYPEPEDEYEVAHIWFHPGRNPSEICGHVTVTQRRGGNNEER